jgi:protein phosphatase
VQISHGLAQSLAEIDTLPEGIHEPFCKEIEDFLDSLVSHYVFDNGKLVVAHAGMRAEMQGRGSGKVRDFVCHRLSLRLLS